ncbi:hypothetical protein Tco_1242496, partial [Tanacetum coccineum]
KYSYLQKDLGNPVDASDEARLQQKPMLSSHVTWRFRLVRKAVVLVADEGVLALFMNWLMAMHLYSK